MPSVFVSISDAYTSAVRAGHVRVLRGYVHSGHDNTLVVSPTRPSPLSPSPSEPPVQAPSLSPSSSQGHAGTLTQTQGEPRPSLISPSGEASLTDVDDLILCTGWGPDLGFMDEALLGAMEYERAESLLPLLLYKEVRSAPIYYISLSIPVYTDKFTFYTCTSDCACVVTFSFGVCFQNIRNHFDIFLALMTFCH